MKGMQALLLLCCFVVLSAMPAWGRQRVYVQPLGHVEQAEIDRIVTSIGKLFDIDVKAAPEIAMPSAAYYAPRKRYRADKLLDFLNYLDIALKGQVVGVTQKDISVTKGDVFDWGIFGYGFAPGRVCVVSTFRLRHGKASGELFLQRLERIALHELGHTFGLLHCPAPGCLMNDARGRITTVDNSSGRFCSDCREKLDASLKAERDG